MPDDSRYEMALQTALAILHELATRPGMSGPEKLSAVTFTILRTIHEAEDRPGGSPARYQTSIEETSARPVLAAGA